MNSITLIDAVEGLQTLATSSVPFTLTSPPWDDMRDYGGHEWDFSVFKAVAAELWRVTTEGGIVCWNHKDAIRGGSHTCTGFRHALYFKRLGFRLHELIGLDEKRRCNNSNRHSLPPELVFVFSKGRPRCFHVRRDRPNLSDSVGRQRTFRNRTKEGVYNKSVGTYQCKPVGRRTWIWNHCPYLPPGYQSEHPARMPGPIAHDFIETWSNRNDLVLDPFCGSGTTCEQAFLLGRKYIGFDIWDVAVRIARRRMREAQDKVWE